MPFGEAGVEVPGDGVEAVLAEVAGHEAQVVGDAVGAGFRRHGAKEIQDEVEDEERRSEYDDVTGDWEELAGENAGPGEDQ